MYIGRTKKILLLASALVAIMELQEIQWFISKYTTKDSASSIPEEKKIKINNFTSTQEQYRTKHSVSSVAEEREMKIANFTSTQGDNSSELEIPSWIKNVGKILI